jgi:hypothetical protein
LLIVRRFAGHGTGVDVVACEGEVAGAGECVQAGCGGEVEDEVADFALDGVGVEFEVEDGAYVIRGYGGPGCGGICGVGVLGANGNEEGGGDGA